MKKSLLIFSLIIFTSCDEQTILSSLGSIFDSYINNELSSEESSSSTSEEIYSSSEENSIISSSKPEQYKEKIKIYINPSVQINNLYYDKITTEAYAMNKVGKIIYDELSKDERFIVYINDRMLKLSDSIKESNSYNVDYHLALHTNAGGGTGSEAFYYSNSSFAKLILNDFVKTHNFPNRGVKKATNLYELKNSTAKHKTLVEFLFHDNKLESEYIKNNYTSFAMSVVNSFNKIANN